jgi:hypothetical protein
VERDEKPDKSGLPSWDSQWKTAGESWLPRWDAQWSGGRKPPPARPDAEEELPPGAFRVGEAIGKSFSIWAGNLPRLALLSLVFHLPLLVAGYFLLRPLQGLPTEQAFWEYFELRFWEFLVSFFLIWKLVTGAVTYAVVKSLRGERPSLLRCLETAVRRFVPLALAAVVASFLTVLPLFIFGGLGRASGGLILLLLFPTALIYAVFYVVEPVVVAERPRYLGLAALGRSAELTQGRRGAIFGLLLLLGLCALAFGLVFGAVVEHTLRSEDVIAEFYLRHGFAIVFMPVLSVVPGVVYHGLRLGREGVDVTEIAKVFE